MAAAPRRPRAGGARPRDRRAGRHGVWRPACSPSRSPRSRRRARRLASPESRHLLFALPFFSVLVAAGILRATRGRPRWRRRRRGARRRRGRLGVAAHAAAVRVGAGRSPGGARGSGGVAGADGACPATSSSATSPSSSAPGRRTATSRARFCRARTPTSPCGPCSPSTGRSAAASGSSTRASATTSTPRSRSTAALRRPRTAFEVARFGPFLVVRSRDPVPRRTATSCCAGRAQLLGRSLGIGDADVNLLTIERADRALPGLRRLAAFLVQHLAVAGRALEGGEPAGVCRRWRRAPGRRAAAAAEAPRALPITNARNRCRRRPSSSMEGS